jgi:hypothetical protein
MHGQVMDGMIVEVRARGVSDGHWTLKSSGDVRLPRPAFASSTNNCSGSFATSRHTPANHIIASPHHTIAKAAYAYNRTRCEELRDAFPRATVPSSTRSRFGPWSCSTPGLHSTNVALTALTSRNPTGPVVLRTVQTLDRLACQPRDRARPLSPLHQISTSKHWWRATKTFLTSTGYHAT